jgi:hypothetical protein
MDRPTPILIPPTELENLDQSSVLELGTLPVYRWPVATFTGEGGIQSTVELPWTEAADRELTACLERLLNETGSGSSSGGAEQR